MYVFEVWNLTPHAVTLNFTTELGEVISTTFQSRGLARVDTKSTEGETIVIPADERTLTSSLPTIRSEMGAVYGLPDPVKGRVYVVSLIVLNHPSVRGRADVFAPATGPKDGCIRDEKGQPVAVTKLVAAPHAEPCIEVAVLKCSTCSLTFESRDGDKHSCPHCGSESRRHERLRTDTYVRAC